ncbi:hypothetical protein F4802DRAFT_115988 [Xylaria palmicola]|nr:hypothetical protein F4802DRAFT_115988 [Xylaria palmicola]
MESGNTFRDLDIEALQNMSLEELKDTVRDSVVANGSRAEIFSVLMGWLNEQIKQDIVTQKQHILEEFVDLLQMNHHRDITSFSVPEVDEVFNEWLEKDAMQNPAYRRRYLITQQDIHILFDKETPSFQDHQTSLAESQCVRQGKHSPGRLPKQEDNDDDKMSVENGSANAQQETDHSISPSADQHSASSKRTRLAGINKPDQPSRHTPTGMVRPQHLDKTHYNESDTGNLRGRREDISADSSPDWGILPIPTKTGRRGFQCRENGEPVPRSYICRRCHEPGHWIQHCPTNLDPRYDQAPDPGYRCNFCGQQGDHFATLCSKNPYEGSLAKQRRNARAKARKHRSPTRSGRRHRLDQGSPVTCPWDRHRSRSPEHRSRSRYRPHSPKYRHISRSRIDIHNPRARYEDDRRHPEESDESDESRYTIRTRLPRGLARNPDHTEGVESPSWSWDDPPHLERQHITSPPLKRPGSPPASRLRKRRRGLDKLSKRSEEGRLAYDDEKDAPIEPSPVLCSHTDGPSRRIVTGLTGEEGVTGSDSSSVPVTLDDLHDIENKAEQFLRALAAEFSLAGAVVAQPVAEDTDEMLGADSSPTSSAGDDALGAALEELVLQATPSPKYHVVHCPQFSPEVVSLFRSREIPIINRGTPRKTACHFWTRCHEQADRVSDVHCLRRHRISDDEVEDGEVI